MSNLGLDIYQANAEIRSRSRNDISDSVSDESGEGSSSNNSDYESKRRARLGTGSIRGSLLQAAIKNAPKSISQFKNEFAAFGTNEQFPSTGIISIFSTQKTKNRSDRNGYLFSPKFP